MPGLVTLALVAGAALGVLLLVGGGNFLVELLDDGDVGEAAVDSRRLLVAIMGAVAGLIGTGIVSVGQFVDGVAGILSISPWGLSNLGAIGLGWLGITGNITIGPRTYVAATVGFLGLALIASEVKG